jgi:predicted nucleic acid-binding protein
MLVAADTNVLLDLALRTEAVMVALETLRERIPKIRLVVPPTVLHELALAVKSGTEKKRKAAFLALSGLREEWGFEPLNLVPVGHGIVERIADTLRNEGLVPMEMNDSLIVAETALLGCGILLSTDGHMRGIDFQRLKLLFQEFHVAAPIIATPREIVRKFCR